VWWPAGGAIPSASMMAVGFDRAVKTLRHEGRPCGATTALMTVVLTALVWRLPGTKAGRPRGALCV
jgi:hypothetical protein